MNSKMNTIHREREYQYVDNAIYFPNKKGEKTYLCRYIDIERIYTDAITNEVKVVLQYIHNKRIRKITVERENFTKYKLLNLLPKYGVDVSDFNVESVLDYLLYREEQVKHYNIHRKIGWHEIEGNKVFLHHEVIGGDIESLYDGDFNIQPKGSIEGFFEVIKDEVIGNIPMELALIIGFSAPIASRLKKLIGIDVLFFHLYGGSTTGKTTALTVATAPFGYPSKSNNGLIKTWLATYNALIGYLNGVHGIPIGLDEASVNAKNDYSNTIYQIADGIDKARQNKHGVNKDRAEWSGTIISTAENSLLGKSNSNVGLRVRLLELPNIQWTTSAENAENIKMRLLENYGHAGMEFIKYLINIDDDTLIEKFYSSKKLVISNFENKDEFTDRIADKIAVVYMTAIMVKDCFKLEIQENEIMKILIQADNRQIEDRNLYVKAYEYIKEEITRNINKFYYKGSLKTYNPNTGEYGEEEQPKSDVYGKLIFNGSQMIEAYIPRGTFNKLLANGGFTDTDLILHKWREVGIIEADEGKYTKKKVIVPKSSNRCVCIKFEKENTSIEKKETIGRKPRKRPTKKIKMKDEGLLNDEE